MRNKVISTIWLISHSYLQISYSSRRIYETEGLLATFITEILRKYKVRVSYEPISQMTTCSLSTPKFEKLYVPLLAEQ